MFQENLDLLKKLNSGAQSVFWADISPQKIGLYGFGRLALRWTEQEQQHLTISVENGSDPKYIEWVRTGAKDWEVACSGKVHFDVQDSFDKNALIRITFSETNEFCSLIGNESRTKNLEGSDFSMSLGFKGLDISDNDALGHVRHELGHALALLHEHQNPGSSIPWKPVSKLVVISGLDADWLHKNIVDREIWTDELFGQPGDDKESVMRYEIPKKWVTNDSFAANRNLAISKGDIKTVTSR